MNILDKAFIIVATLLVGACSSEKGSTSSVASAPAANSSQSTLSQGCDLAVTGAQSNEAVRGQLQCLRSIADSVGPGWVSAALAVTDIVNLVQTMNSSSITLTEDENESAASNEDSVEQNDEESANAPTKTDLDYFEKSQFDQGLALTADEPLVMNAWQFLNTLANGVTSNTNIRPRWLGRCVSDVSTLSSNIKQAVDAARNLTDGVSLSAESIQSIYTAVTEGTSSALRLGTTLQACTPGNNVQAMAQFRALVGRFAGFLERVQGALGVVGTLHTCGVNITRGAIVLANNTSCLMSDLAALRQSNLAVVRQANATVPVVEQTENLEVECPGLASRQAHRAGQYCSNSLQDTTFYFNSSIRNACVSCCERALGGYMSGNSCNFGDRDVRFHQPICAQRCYLARGGT